MPITREIIAEAGSRLLMQSGRPGQLEEAGLTFDLLVAAQTELLGLVKDIYGGRLPDCSAPPRNLAYTLEKRSLDTPEGIYGTEAFTLGVLVGRLAERGPKVETLKCFGDCDSELPRALASERWFHVHKAGSGRQSFCSLKCLHGWTEDG